MDGLEGIGKKFGCMLCNVLNISLGVYENDDDLSPFSGVTYKS
jgi:hypothetical protein